MPAAAHAFSSIHSCCGDRYIHWQSCSLPPCLVHYLVRNPTCRPSARFLFTLNQYCQEVHGMKYNLADYSVYEFYKAGAGNSLGQGSGQCR